MVRAIAFLIAALAAGLVGTSLAREWTDSTGENKTEAEFVEVLDGAARLRLEDGRLISVPLSRLSAADVFFAVDEAWRRELDVPRLSEPGRAKSQSLVEAVRMACAPYAERDARETAWKAMLRDGRKAFFAHSPALVELEGARAALTPAIIEMLRDKNPAVRITAAAVMEDIGTGASGALPTLFEQSGDGSRWGYFAAETVQSFCRFTDAPAAVLAAAVAGDDLKAARRGAGALSELNTISPRLAESVPVLTAALRDGEREPKLRAVAGEALYSVLNKLEAARGRMRNRDSLHLRDVSVAMLSPELKAALVGTIDELLPATGRALSPHVEDEGGAGLAAARIATRFSPDAIPLEDLAALAEHEDAEMRARALELLSRRLLRDRNDLSWMPALRVRVTADEEGAVKSIAAADANFDSLAALRKAVEEFKPPDIKHKVDIEAVLKKATTDAEKDVRTAALIGLAGRNTQAARATLKELSETALDGHVRDTTVRILRGERVLRRGVIDPLTLMDDLG